MRRVGGVDTERPPPAATATTQGTPSTAAAASIEVSITYLVYTGQAPLFHHSLTAGERMAMAGQREKRIVTIHNGRPDAARFSLDVEGFACDAHVTEVGDFFDDAALASAYTPEVEERVARHARAGEVVAFDHTRRSSDAATRERHSARDPIAAAHVDDDRVSAMQRLRDVLGEAAEARPALRHHPCLALDWAGDRAVAAGGLRRNHHRRRAAVLDGAPCAGARRALVRSRPRQRDPPRRMRCPSRTYHFPRMTRNEVLVFKNFDTETQGVAPCAMHTAFEDPGTPANPAPRESIECRARAFYD
jgi:hypothetical protein